MGDPGPSAAASSHEKPQLTRVEEVSSEDDRKEKKGGTQEREGSAAVKLC